MAWNPNSPSSADTGNNWPAEAQANWAAIAASILAEHQPLGGGSDGVHNIPILTSVPAVANGQVKIINNQWWWCSNGVWQTFAATLPDTSLVLTASVTGAATGIFVA